MTGVQVARFSWEATTAVVTRKRIPALKSQISMQTRSSPILCGSSPSPIS